MKKEHLRIPLIALGIIIAFALGRCTGGMHPAPTPSHPEEHAAAPQLWTCSMHPQIKLPEPGKCPICSMDLIPLTAGDSGGGERELTVSPYAAKLMEIETTTVVRRTADAEVRMVGTVNYDDTNVATISAWVPGRIDRLFVETTGEPIRKGDPLAEFYSPELLSAQQELLQAIRSVDSLQQSDSTIMRSVSKSTVEAVRKKLRLWGFTPEQIAAIEQRGTPSDHMTLTAPASGIVIHQNAQEGMYVQTGSKIYTIADLSTVWVQLDAYESDLGLLRTGSPVEFTTQAIPGERFEGTVTFIDPIINTATRTAKVRVIVDNADGHLKPGMFVRAVARPKVAEEALLIPVSAALKTGKRAVVYVEQPNADKPTYEGREVRLGMRAGDLYVVKEGLREGERVVTHGSFKLDAELQLRAKPSMMSLPSESMQQEPKAHTHMPEMKPVEIPAKFSAQLRDVVQAYYDIHTALAADDAEAAGQAAQTVLAALGQVQMERLKDDAHRMWMKHLSALNAASDNLIAAPDMEARRAAFYPLSQQLAKTLQAFPIGHPVYQAFCPMAFDNTGAIWLQDSEQIANPYFGEMMPECGEIQKTLGEGHE